MVGGVNGLFASRSNETNNSGFLAASEFVSSARRVTHRPQRSRRIRRSLTRASHSWPRSQRHAQTLAPLPALMPLGPRPFLAASHSFANSKKSVSSIPVRATCELPFALIRRRSRAVRDGDARR